ncbi:MAG: LysR substrate-binding domain-containing protein [Pseudomonadota bacterium]
MDSQLHLRHLRTFLEIARLESVTRAAEALNISQPAVSRSLRELEDILGTELFDRVGRGLRLNAAGRIFQSHTASALVELVRGRERVRTDRLRETRLSVGVLPTAAGDLAPRAALAFHTERPNTRLHVVTGPNWLLFNQLRERKLDLVVGRMPEQSNLKGLSFEQLYLETVVLVCRPGHPILNTSTIGFALGEYPLILPPSGAVIAGTVTRYLASIGLPEMRGAFETVALPVGRRIVEGSDTLWFISRGVVEDELESGRLAAVTLDSPLLSGPVGISQVDAAGISVERRLFIECLRAAVATQDEAPGPKQKRP